MHVRTSRFAALLGLIALVALAALGPSPRRIIAQRAPAPTTPPAAQAGGASITVDKPQYRVGELIRICYRVPGPGPVTIIDLTPDGRSSVVVSGNDDGTGGCFTATAAPPTGTECVRLDYRASRGSDSVQTCFQVLPAPSPTATPTPTPPPTPMPTRTPSPTATPSPTPTPIASPNSAPTPTPTVSPTPGGTTSGGRPEAGSGAGARLRALLERDPGLLERLRKTVEHGCGFFGTHEDAVNTYLVGKDVYEFIEAFAEEAAKAAEAAEKIVLDPRDIISFIVTNAVVNVAVEQIDPEQPVHYRHFDDGEDRKYVTLTVRVFSEFDLLDQVVDCLKALKIEIPHSGGVPDVDVGVDTPELSRHCGMTADHDAKLSFGGAPGTFFTRTDEEGRAQFTCQVKDEARPNGTGTLRRETAFFKASADPYSVKNPISWFLKLLPGGMPAKTDSVTFEWHDPSNQRPTKGGTVTVTQITTWEGPQSPKDPWSDRYDARAQTTWQAEFTDVTEDEDVPVTEMYNFSSSFEFSAKGRFPCSSVTTKSESGSITFVYSILWLDPGGETYSLGVYSPQTDWATGNKSTTVSGSGSSCGESESRSYRTSGGGQYYTGSMPLPARDADGNLVLTGEKVVTERYTDIRGMEYPESQSPCDDANDGCLRVTRTTTASWMVTIRGLPGSPNPGETSHSNRSDGRGRTGPIVQSFW